MKKATPTSSKKSSKALPKFNPNPKGDPANHDQSAPTESQPLRQRAQMGGQTL